jgi:hypothetical protein
MLFITNTGGEGVWNLEIWSLGFVCDLVFGAWDFDCYHKALIPLTFRPLPG